MKGPYIRLSRASSRLGVVSVSDLTPPLLLGTEDVVIPYVPATGVIESHESGEIDRLARIGVLKATFQIGSEMSRSVREVVEHVHEAYALAEHYHEEYAVREHAHGEYADVDHAHEEYVRVEDLPGLPADGKYAPADHVHSQYALVTVGGEDDPTGIVEPKQIGEIYIGKTERGRGREAKTSVYIATGTGDRDWTKL